ncbi:MAG: PQQ-dependent sugar dehydrogenase [Phycisphaerales bacterium]
MGSFSRRTQATFVAAMFIASLSHAQNTPPTTPTILEPQLGHPLDPADIHMETAPFEDAQAAPNGSQVHLCTDWEIYTVEPDELVWYYPCASGFSLVHTHLGDGTFVNSHGSLTQLRADTQYRFRVRHRDNSGDPFTEWSNWSERVFTTGPVAQVLPMELHDVVLAPAPQLITPAGQPFTLPAAPTTPHSIKLVGACCGALMLEVAGPITTSATQNNWTNPEPLPMHMVVKLVVNAGDAPLSLPQLDLTLTTGAGKNTSVLLPAISLASGETAEFWVTTNGSTYVKLETETEPNFTTIARQNLTPWTTREDVRVSLVATGFQLPVNIAFIPNAGTQPNDPFFYVTELYGNIKVVTRDGTVSDYASNLLNFNPTGNFPGSGEVGVTGIVIDPVNGDVYATMVYANELNPEDTYLYPKVVKFTSTDGGRTAATQTTVLDLFPFTSAPSHQISTILLGADDNFYIHVGDAFDIEAGQNLDDFRGKILRVNRSFQPVATNPFYNANDGITARDFIYTRGYRNPFGGAFRRSDNRHFCVENGPGTDRLSETIMGRNYAYDGTDESMHTFAMYNWFPTNAPVQIAFLEQSIFNRSGFPAQYEGRAYVTQSGGTWSTGPSIAGDKQVTEFVIGAQDTLISGPTPIAMYNGQGKASCSALAVGPDGIYFADLYKDDSLFDPTARGSSVLKLSFLPPPDCNANNIPDAKEISENLTPDLNANNIPDSCDIARQFSQDCDTNGVPDEAQTTTPLITDFANGPGPWFVNGQAVLSNGIVELDTIPGGDEGAIVLPPFTTTPLSYIRGQAEFRLTGPLNYEGTSLSFADETFSGDYHFFGEDGPRNNSLAARIDQAFGDPDAREIAILRNGNVVASKKLDFALDDGEWRTLELVSMNSGVTVRLEKSPGNWLTIFENVIVPGFQPYIARAGMGANRAASTATYQVRKVSIWVHAGNDLDQDYIPDHCPCNDIDFNNDTSVFDPLDIDDYLSVFGEGPCSTPVCDDIDFNNDTSLFDPIDIDTFLRVFGEGPCVQ